VVATHDDLSAVFAGAFAEATRRFRDLMVQGERVFLIGAGCSKCAGLP